MRLDDSKPEEETGPGRNETKVYVGMDAHKDGVRLAVLPEGSAEAGAIARGCRPIRSK